MSESTISIGYLDKDKIRIDLNRKEGTETISLDDFCTLIERHQWLLEEAYELAKEKRIDRVRDRHIKEDEEREKVNKKDTGESHINDVVTYMTNSNFTDPATSYMTKLLDAAMSDFLEENSRSDADPGL